MSHNIYFNLHREKLVMLKIFFLRRNINVNFKKVVMLLRKKTVNISTVLCKSFVTDFWDLGTHHKKLWKAYLTFKEA